MLTEGADPVRKVSIIPRGLALGVTFAAPETDRYNYREPEALAKIKVALGGRAAEEVVFDEISTGAESDIEQLTEIARQMVGRWGMSPAIGPIAVLPRDGTGPFLPAGSEASPDTQTLVDAEVRRIVEESHKEVVALLKENRGQARLARRPRCSSTRRSTRRTSYAAAGVERATELRGPSSYFGSGPIPASRTSAVYDSRSRIPSGRRNGATTYTPWPRLREPSSSSRPISIPTSAALGPASRSASSTGCGNDDSGHLVVQAQRELVAPDGEDPDQHGDRPLSAEPVDEAVHVLEVEQDLGHREVRAGFDLAVEAVELRLEVVGGRVDRDADVEGRGRVDRSPVVVLAAVQARHQVREPDRVDLVDAARARVVADLGRIAGHREHVADAARVRAEELRLEAHDRRVARRQVRDRLDAALRSISTASMSALAAARAVALSLMSTKPAFPDCFKACATSIIPA